MADTGTVEKPNTDPDQDESRAQMDDKREVRRAKDEAEWDAAHMENPHFVLLRNNLREGIIAAEILGPPVALRD